MRYMISAEVVLLLSGPVSVGKTTLRNLLVKHRSFGSIRSSTYLRGLATATTGTRRLDLQELGDGLDRQTDYRWVLDNVALPQMAANPRTNRWLFDAVRKQRQIEHFRDSFGQSVFHLHLNAPEEVLRERYEHRLREIGEPVEGAYDRAIAHENERLSRSLIHVADAIVDTFPASDEDVLGAVLTELHARFGMAN